MVCVVLMSGPREKIPYYSPFRPTINRVVGRLSSSNLLPHSLEMDDIVRRSISLAGSDDFGGDDWSEPLGLLLDGYASTSRLTELGRLVARRLVIGMLTNRLRTFQKLNNLGDLNRVRQPVFILGLPRTGSTLLHELLDIHPQLRTPKLWQADSVPNDDWTDWQRVFTSFLRTKMVDVISPGFKSIHRLGATRPHECVTIQGLSFRSMQFHAIHRVDGYHEWLGRCDWSPAYLWHERYLRVLSNRFKSDERWLLKAPGHMLGIEALWRQYPDAKLIQLHRHPREVIPSMASLYASLRSGCSDQVDFHQLGESLLEEWRVGLDRVLNLRRSEEHADRSCLDLSYKDMIGDPLRAVEQILEFLGLPFDQNIKLKMEDYLVSNRKDKHGKHRYDLDFFGLTDNKIELAFSEYIEAHQLGN